MKMITLLAVGLLGSLSAQATPGAWVEKNTHNTAIVQTVDVFNPDAAKDVIFRITGPVNYSVCDLGAKLEGKMILVDKIRNQATYYVDFDMIPYGDSGECKPGEPVPAMAVVGAGATKWMKVKGGRTLMLVLPQDYKIELQK